MLRFLSISKVRQNLLSLVDEVGTGGEIVIAKRGIPKAVIVNFDRLQTLQTVARLWQDPKALRAMRRSLDESKQGKMLKLKKSETLTVAKVLSVARKKGLLRD